MKTSHRLVLAFALALGVTATGCGAAEPSMVPDPGPGPGPEDDGNGDIGGDGDGSSEPPPKPLDATGTYAVHSTFDLATNMPGTAGTVINTIIAVTDGDDQPTRWILEQIAGQIDNTAVRETLLLLAALGAGPLQDELLELAPDFVSDFVSTVAQVGDDFGNIATQFGLNETLELTRTGTGYTAVHTVTGVHFDLETQAADFTLANYHMDNIVVNNVAMTMDETGQLTIAAHDIPLAYGQLLRLGLDAAIIPLIDPSARNLGDLLANLIDCQKIANVVKDHLPFGIVISASTLTSACNLGIRAGAAYVYSKIDDIDATALRFGLRGTARGTDKNKDRNIDTIQTGTWDGTLSYGTTPTPLIPAAFFGERM